MARALKPADPKDRHRLFSALLYLRTARRLLREAGAEKAVEKVRAALKSAEGAERHLQRRLSS